jgi:TonB family protein
VFEIFSSYPDSFRDRDVQALQEMARWVQDAVAGSTPVPKAKPAEALFESPPESSAKVAEAIRLEEARLEQSAQLLSKRDQTTRILRGVAIALAVLLCILVVLRWTRSVPATTAQAGSGVNRNTPVAHNGSQFGSDPVADTGLANVLPKPPSGHRKGPTKNAALILKDTISSGQGEPSSVSDRNDSTRPNASDQNGSRVSDQVSTTPAKDQLPAQIPATEMASAGSGPLRDMPAGLNPVVSPPTLKVPDPVVSKGVEEGRLIHSVQPRYPVDAMQRRIEGTVVLHATIGKDGAMHDVKSVRGDRVLLQAAMDAVRQWRYKPYMLNGVAVDMPIDITINFSVPK